MASIGEGKLGVEKVPPMVTRGVLLDMAERDRFDCPGVGANGDNGRPSSACTPIASRLAVILRPTIRVAKLDQKGFQ